jgi:hypothetical protein
VPLRLDKKDRICPAWAASPRPCAPRRVVGSGGARRVSSGSTNSSVRGGEGPSPSSAVCAAPRARAGHSPGGRERIQALPALRSRRPETALVRPQTRAGLAACRLFAFCCGHTSLVGPRMKQTPRRGSIRTESPSIAAVEDLGSHRAILAPNRLPRESTPRRRTGRRYRMSRVGREALKPRASRSDI